MKKNSEVYNFREYYAKEVNEISNMILKFRDKVINQFEMFRFEDDLVEKKRDAFVSTLISDCRFKASNEYDKINFSTLGDEFSDFYSISVKSFELINEFNNNNYTITDPVIGKLKKQASNILTKINDLKSEVDYVNDELLKDMKFDDIIVVD